MPNCAVHKLWLARIQARTSHCAVECGGVGQGDVGVVGNPKEQDGCKGSGKICWSQHRLWLAQGKWEEIQKKQNGGRGDKSCLILYDGIVYSSGGIKFEEGWNLLSMQRNNKRQTRNVMKFSISLNFKNIAIDWKVLRCMRTWFRWDVPDLSAPKFMQPHQGAAWL